VPPNITRGVHGARSPGAAAAPARAPLTPKALMREAVLARAPSYSPYSRFAVGAALQGASGAVYHGCNVENASFGLTCCAERSAVFQAVSAGEQSFTAIAVTARAGQGAPPCGACRQVLAEFAPNLVVYWRDQRGHILKKKLSVLLPDQFDLVQPGGTRR
jgi:cytidine deaminase